jgi:signal transduction histidine kinase
MIDAKSIKEKTENLKVLYVEDDELLRAKTTTLLRNLFGSVDIASDGQEGLDVYKEYSYDIVISDVNMPNMNGTVMSRAIKEINPDQVIIITSAHDESQYLIDLIETGIDYFILKPIDVSKFLNVISNAASNINNKRAIEEKKSLLIQGSRLTAMGEMAGMIAHQWRQPLSSITLKLQSIKLFMQMDILDKEKTIKDIDKVNTTVQEMSKIIDNFRKFFKPNNDKSIFNLIDAVDSSIVLLAKEDIGDIKILKELDDVDIYTYRCTFSQIIFQFVANAIDAINNTKPKNGQIRIKSSVDKDSITIAVDDNGGGIPEEIFDNIFDPYFSTKAKNAKGLGLYNIKLAIEDYMGGTIDVSNVDNGAKFTINFPIK